ncbi:hypothetical protein K413DRAFT_4757 [Clostridium sp. ASBs410]|nr:hypothetical protein K413DRAFT_4757 [Clostridium sp. ASBs410]
MKRLLVLLMTATIAICSTFVSFAGEWKQNDKGWWYQNDDGSYVTSSWKEIDGKQYYFGWHGYMLHDTTTPDGYYVGSDGAWIPDGEILNSEAVNPLGDKDLAIQTLANLMITLKDPNSLEVNKIYCQTIVGGAGAILRQVVIRYSATNTYGGRVADYYSAWASPKDGSLVLDSGFRKVTQEILNSAFDKTELNIDEILPAAQQLANSWY